VLDYDQADVQDVFGLTFAVTLADPLTGAIATRELRRGGADVPVTVYNRADFVQRYVRFLLHDAIETPLRAFREGIHAVLEPDILKVRLPALQVHACAVVKAVTVVVACMNVHMYVRTCIMYVYVHVYVHVCMCVCVCAMRLRPWGLPQLFHPRELEFLVRGAPTYHFAALEATVEYRNGYSASHPVVQWFWQTLHTFPTDLKRKFLLFLTGSDRVPLAGLAALRLIIQRTGDPGALPAAHTCHNVLDLPEYPTREVLQAKLVYAITNTEGFGLV
jgi:hypothetical protein